jgi:hypothetical protein
MKQAKSAAMYYSLIFDKYTIFFEYLIDKEFISRSGMLKDVKTDKNTCYSAFAALNKANLIKPVNVYELTEEQKKHMNRIKSVHKINKYMLKIYLEAYNRRQSKVNSRKPPSKDIHEAIKPFAKKVFCSADYVKYYQVTKQTANAHLKKALKENVIKLFNMNEAKHKEAGYKKRNYYICTNLKTE